METSRITLLLAFVVAGLFSADVACAQETPPAASLNPFGVIFDKDPTKSDSEVRYNHQGAQGYSHIISGVGLNSTAITGANPDSISVPADQQIKMVDGIPTVTRRNSVSGVEWDDMNNFSRHGSTEYPEEKLHNELKKPLPERRPFGDRMKEISDQLKGTTPQ
jgi:hypothetical protein